MSEAQMYQQIRRMWKKRMSRYQRYLSRNEDGHSAHRLAGEISDCQAALDQFNHSARNRINYFRP